MKSYALDTGPIVALLNRRDLHHRWARDALDTIVPPLSTCEAVISEACFLLRHLPGGPDAVLALVERDILRVDFRAGDHTANLRKLMHKYRDVPMSFADACLVRMSEVEPDMTVVTLDGDFGVYRRLGRQLIPLVTLPRT